MRKSLLLFIVAFLLMAGCMNKEDVPPPSIPDEVIITFAPLPMDTQPASSIGESQPPEKTENPNGAAPVNAANFTLDEITFLGDSTTYGLKAYAMLSGGKSTTQVWTPASGTLALFNQSFATIVYPATGEEIPIRDAVADGKPEYLVLTLGVNGVSMMEETDFTADYSDLIEGILAASPNTTIILQSIFPVASHYEHLKQINNEKISRANGWVQAIAVEYKLTYIDTYSKLIGADNWLPENLQNGDGMHLNADGFTIVLDNICNELGISR